MKLTNNFTGIEIRESTALTETSDPFKVRKSWKERLISWPWKPWVKTKWVTKQVPSDEIMHDRVNNVFYCHPVMKKQLEQEIYRR